MATDPPYAGLPDDFKPVYTASCHCGRVQYEVAVEKPLDAKYCHCKDCQRLHGAPFQWAAIVNKSDVRFLPGVQDHLEFYKSSTETSSKTRPDPPSKLTCQFCHSLIMDEGRKMCMLFPTLIKFPSKDALALWQPTCHIFYEERACDIPDGKPKWPRHKDDGEPMREPTPA
ncbi:hypothetical protein FS837_005428 [Tulasnella sp. UAMH 9824]|nr:hypothetical protein FS837_005428 [Tulasnella sp. UAMH 9824]